MAADDPFVGPAPAEIFLSHAPLARIVTQVRFQTILALNETSGVADFQEAIRADYPAFRQEDAREVTLLPTGEVRSAPQNVWRFADASEDWTIAVASTFIALETRANTNSRDFLRRLATVFDAAQTTFRPKLVDRIGLRYVNRVQGSALARIRELVRPEMLGIAGGILASRIQLSLSETHIVLAEEDGDRMLLRHGLLPAQATYDPGAVPASDAASWVLDLDAYRDRRMEFEAHRLGQIATSLAEKEYRMFRWVVSDEFLREHGGQL
jgi:uncharacterized protein (TIGR04255 family)